MKPPPFRYTRVDDTEHALERLAELGSDAKVLAGGQSLLPMMSFRLARPGWLVDISRAGELRGARATDGEVHIGALTRHRELGELRGCPVLPATVPLIAHEPVRTLGTFGGSVAHADAASEWCVLTLLLDGRIAARSVRGAREVHADAFFHGTFTTDLAEDEVLTGVRLRVPSRAALCEHSRRHGDFGLVLIGVAFDWTAGRCTRARIVAGGVDAVPVRLPAAERVIDGTELDDGALAECAAQAAAEVDPGSDVHATADDRRALTAVLVRRALRQAREAA